MAAEPPTLQGPHVLLEPLRLEHAPLLWPAAAERELWRYMTFDVATIEDLRRWIQLRLDALAARTALPFLIRDSADQQPIGSSSIFDFSAARTMEIGHTWLGSSHRRTAANTEAKLLLLSHCFGPLQAIRVQFKCDERNARSRKAIERLGAVYEGTVRNQMVLTDGHRRNGRIYSVLDSEWPRIRDRLEEALRR